MPQLDWEHSWARFFHPRFGTLSFTLHRIVETDPRNPQRIRRVVAELRPARGAETPLDRLPPEGVRGEIFFAARTGNERRPAVLLPLRQPLFDLLPGHPVPEQRGSAWAVHPQEDGSVVVPLAWRPACALWLHEVLVTIDSPPGAEAALAGLEVPSMTPPARVIPFRLEIQKLPLPLAAPVRVRLKWNFGPAGSVEVLQTVVVLNSPRLVVKGPSKKSVEVAFGQKTDLPYPLVIHIPHGAPADETALRIIDVEVWREPDEGGWLEVASPPRESLPLEVLPDDPERLPAQVLLAIDTSRLDRQRFDGRTLKGGVRLLDHLGRHWPCEVQATIKPRKKLDHYFALDWGTTNSCAAYCVGDRAQSVPLEEQQRAAPERFASDVYFEDVSNPQAPAFHVGEIARSLADLHPECCLRSVKRKFQHRDEVLVMDEKGRTHTYAVTDLVWRLLHRLISLAEVQLGSEIVRLGLTFPTKWTASTRRKLEHASAELAKHMAKERRPFAVDILPPQVDEANACAIGLLTLANTDGFQLPQDRFVLVAYDFGGGTVDTSVLEVTFPSGAPFPSTRYLGIGGRSDFGGDEVTRAVVLLLHERLTEALEARRLRYEVPLVADGAPFAKDESPGAAERDRIGRGNWGKLWEAAELIKMDLCEPGGGGSPVRDRLEPRRTTIKCWSGTADSPAVRDLAQVLGRLSSGAEAEKFYRELAFSLEDVYDYKLDDVEHTNDGHRFSVRERVEDTVQQLKRQCEEAGVRPDVIVLAGGGSRLPLVSETIRRLIPPRHPGNILFNHRFAKQRVAHGMASYLHIRENYGEFGQQLVRSVDVLHRHLGLQQLKRMPNGQIRLTFQPVARLGTPLNAPSTWHDFEFETSHVRLSPDGRLLALSVQYWREGPREKTLGQFNLDRPGEPLSGETELRPEPAPPLLPGARYKAALRLAGADRIDLRLALDGHTFGPFPLVPEVADVESELQG